MVNRCIPKAYENDESIFSKHLTLDSRVSCHFCLGKHAMGTGGSEKLEDEGNETFPGLIPLCQEYLRNIEVDADTMCSLSRYFKVMKNCNRLFFS